MTELYTEDLRLRSYIYLGANSVCGQGIKIRLRQCLISFLSMKLSLISVWVCFFMFPLALLDIRENIGEGMFFKFNFLPRAIAQTLQPRLDQDQNILKQGKPVLTGQDGQYVGKIIIDAPLERIWSVLTDYEKFPKFIPTVTAIKVLEAKGNQKVYEQINVVQVLFFSQKSKIVIAATTSYPTAVSFEMRDADSLKSLRGTWQITEIAPNQFLTFIPKISLKPWQRLNKKVNVLELNRDLRFKSA
jgi:ribosome-associated toxin RatA of RatAB toxin-antitoxin module